MNKDTANEIIRKAMADRSIYDAMAARESEVWGNILPDLERSEARKRDEVASRDLRVSRHQSSLAKVAREKGLHFCRSPSPRLTLRAETKIAPG